MATGLTAVGCGHASGAVWSNHTCAHTDTHEHTGRKSSVISDTLFWHFTGGFWECKAVTTLQPDYLKSVLQPHKVILQYE